MPITQLSVPLKILLDIKRLLRWLMRLQMVQFENHTNHQIQELDNCIAARKAVKPQKERTKERTIYPTRPLGLLRARRLERPNPIRDSNHLQKRALHRQRWRHYPSAEELVSLSPTFPKQLTTNEKQIVENSIYNRNMNSTNSNTKHKGEKKQKFVEGTQIYRKLRPFWGQIQAERRESNRTTNQQDWNSRRTPLKRNQGGSLGSAEANSNPRKAKTDLRRRWRPALRVRVISICDAL